MVEVTSILPPRFKRAEAFNRDRLALGGALEGADRITRETALWRPSLRSPDEVINRAKVLADARGVDSARNTGFISGAVARHKDSIIGSQYRLNARPDWKYLKTINKAFDEVWADEFQQEVEAWFNLLAESEACWLDAQGMNTLTGQLRLAIGIFLMTGEVIATVEWLRARIRPCNTALQLVAGNRLSNPNGVSDTRYLRGGVERDDQGQPIAYNFRMGDPLSPYPDSMGYIWRRVPYAKPWGRQQVIHIIEQQLPDQSRGISDMVSALKNMHMTKRFQEVTLQSAVIQATYAAAIESELSGEVISAVLGAGNADGKMDVQKAIQDVAGGYLTTLTAYLGDATSVRVDGAQIPHLFPGTKLNMMPAKTAGGVGTSFEESLMRHTAAALNLSYEEFSRDFSKTNYSSGRLAMGVSAQAMSSRKRHVADRYANSVYALALEERMASGLVPLPSGGKVTRDVFYEVLAKEAICRASWIGSGAGQIDELKETQAAMLRIGAGLTTWEKESSRLGLDWREVFAQRAREEAYAAELGLEFDLAATKPLGKSDTAGAASDPVVDTPPGSNTGGQE